MIKSGKCLISTAAAALVVTLAATGCATKKYVRNQISPVNQRVNQHEKETTGKLAWLTNKEQTDISQVNERISATDQRVSEVDQRVSEVKSTVEGAQGAAARAMDEAGGNKTGASGVASAQNYQLVDKADVMFAFNKATLTPASRASLDQVAAKLQSMPHAVVEVVGFTDRVGSANYNLDLSRRRAWAVQRYLVEHKVPARSIYMVGLGEERPPDGLEPVALTTTRRGSARSNGAQRRVDIRMFSPGESTAADPVQQ